MAKYTGQFKMLKGDKLIEYDNWFEIMDRKGNVIYYEDKNGTSHTYLFDGNGNVTDYMSSIGLWFKQKSKKDGTVIYFEDNSGIAVDKR